MIPWAEPMLRPRSDRRARSAAVALVLAMAAVASCGFDWDAYDPALGGPTGGTGTSSASVTGPASSGPGGAGGATTSSMSSSGAGASSASVGGGGSGGASPCTPNEVVDCYEGPTGTKDVGICVGGTKTCAPDGSQFGACELQVLPASESCMTAEDEDCDGKAVDDGVEDCATAADDDCDGTPNDHCAIWSKRFGDAVAQHGRGVAVDAAGAVILVGHGAGTVDFGGGALASGGAEDVLVAKLSGAGVYQWAERFGGASDQLGLAVATGPANEVVVVGRYAGTLAFGPLPADMHTSVDQDDAFVVVLDALGAVKWSRSFGGTLDQAALSVAVGAGGAVLVAGEFGGTIDLGAGPVAAVAGLDGFVVALDPVGGTTLWSKTFGGMADDSAQGIAADANGNVLITGYFDEEVDFGGGVLTDGTDEAVDVFVAKLDAAGGHVWSKAYGEGPAAQWGRFIGADPLGNVLVTGSFLGDIDFGGGTLTSKGDEDLFVVKLDPAGAQIWAKSFGSPGVEWPRGFTVDAQGRAIVTGTLESVVDFGSGAELAVNGADDVYLFAMGAAGQTLWARRFGGPADQDGLGVAASAAGDILVTGRFHGTIDFGAGTMTTAGDEDIFVARFPP